MGIWEAGKYAEVHPTFLYESICTIIIFVILILKSKKRKFKGEITLIYLITYSFIRMLIETLSNPIDKADLEALRGYFNKETNNERS